MIDPKKDCRITIPQSTTPTPEELQFGATLASTLLKSYINPGILSEGRAVVEVSTEESGDATLVHFDIGFRPRSNELSKRKRYPIDDLLDEWAAGE